MMRTFHYVLLLTCVAGGAACSSNAPEDVETETVVPVQTAKAEVGTVRATLHVSGTVVPAPGADLLVVAPAPARILEIPNAEGDRVARGDLLVRFEIPTMTADAASRRADVARAEARVANAKGAQTRAHDLFDRGVAARKEMEDADREMTDAEAALGEAQAARQASDSIVQRTTVMAPFAGVVAKRLHNPGDLVDASASDPILRIVDPNRLEVLASVPLADVPKVVVGAAARLAGPAGATLRVISRAALIEPGTAVGPIRLGFSEAGRLAVGTPVDVEIDAEQHKNVVVVPATALVREGAETFVFVVEGAKAHRRAVEIGITDGTRLEVLSGIKAGDVVITQGQNGLPDETDIRLDGGVAK